MAREENREVVLLVSIAVLHARTVKNHGVVEETDSALVNALHTFEEVFELLNVPSADASVLFLSLIHI